MKSHLLSFINVISSSDIFWHNRSRRFYPDHYVIMTGALCLESFLFWASVPRFFACPAPCIFSRVVSRIAVRIVICTGFRMVVCTYFRVNVCDVLASFHTHFFARGFCVAALMVVMWLSASPFMLKSASYLEPLLTMFSLPPTVSAYFEAFMSIVLGLETCIKSIVIRCPRFLLLVWSRPWQLMQIVLFCVSGAYHPLRLQRGTMAVSSRSETQSMALTPSRYSPVNFTIVHIDCW